MTWLLALLALATLTSWQPRAAAQSEPRQPTASESAALLRAIAVPASADAVRLAWQDCQTLPAEDRPFQTYFLTVDRSFEFYGAFSYAINAFISHARTIYLPQVCSDGWLIRVDRRRIWPQEEIYKELDAELNKLNLIEPYFHTQGTIVVKEAKTQPKWKLVPSEPYQKRDKNGVMQTYNSKYVPDGEEVVEEAEVKQGSEFSLHLLGDDADAAPIVRLSAATASPGLTSNPMPIMRADWFIAITGSTIEEENGKYYTFRRIRDSANGKTAEQLWLEGMAVDYDAIQKLGSDQRVAKWRSNVTAKPRAVEYFFASSTRAATGPAGVCLTRDYLIGKVDAVRHAIKNLLNYKFDGVEAMGFLPNGMMTFVIFDGKGNLVATAPDKLVSDRTVTNPHPTILSPPMSCIRCHGPTDMWMPVTNDIYAMSRGKYGLNIFDDESSAESPEQTLDRLAGLYSGEMSEFLRISRNTHAKATYMATGGMSIPAVAQKLGEIYARYRYYAVTPQIALLEMGWAAEESLVTETYNAAIPPLPPNRHGIIPESVTIGTLRAWTSENQLHVNRDDWEQEYADAMLRAQIQKIRAQAQ